MTAGVEDISTGRVETNILTLHDKENAEEYPPGHTGNLMDRRPINCAECHADNALGAPGVAGIPNLSRAMHDKHAEEGDIPQTTAGCYLCHPGPQTQCLRDVMSERGMDLPGLPRRYGDRVAQPQPLAAGAALR